MTETDDAVEIEVAVGTPARDDNQEYVSFGVRFSTVEARLEHPLGARRIIYGARRGAALTAGVAPAAQEQPEMLISELSELVETYAALEASAAEIAPVAQDVPTGVRSEPVPDPRPSSEISEISEITGNGYEHSLPAGDHWQHWGAAAHGARVVVTRAQWYALAALLLCAGAFVALRPHAALLACVVVVTFTYLATGGYKIWLLIRGERASTRFRPAEPADGNDLPIYSVLVPLYREGRILPRLLEHLERLDYPTTRLQILLLIEADDEETQQAAREYALPMNVQTVILPPGEPRTKPRALNVGLHAAEGEYIVIYDAEDRPEPDQLRKAVAAFRQLPVDVACLQARLNFYNRTQSVLTRLFTVDYATWYDQFLPGLTDAGIARRGAFVPLGGTSNHFRVDALENIGGWDPYNVTEDCDLGARLGREGLRVGLLDSVTWEEAVPHVKPWVKQRSRWVKGYLQTYLVHMRRPRQLWKQLGPRGFTDFQVLVGGSSLILLLNPLMWALTATYMAANASIANFIETLFPTWLYYPSILSFVVGNFVLFYSYAYVCVRRNYVELTRYALGAPLYWVLMSIGAWVGLTSLIRNPFYWAKTEHGVSLSDDHVHHPAPAAVKQVEGSPGRPTSGRTLPEVEDVYA